MKWPGWLLLMVSLCCAGPAAADSTAFDFNIDGEARPDILDMLANADWQPGNSAPTFGFRGDAVWVRAEMPSGPADLLVIDNGWLDDLEVYFVAGDRVVTHFHTGNRYPFRERPIQSPQFTFPVPQEAVDQVYVRSIGHSAHYPAAIVHDQRTVSGALDPARSAAGLLLRNHPRADRLLPRAVLRHP